MVRGQGLDVEGVQGRPGDGLPLQHVDEGLFVDDGPPGDVHQVGRGLHQGQFAGGDQSPAAVAEHHMDRDDVRIFEQGVFVHQGGLAFLGPLGGHVLAPGDDVHVEGRADPGHERPDMAQTEKTQGLALEAHADGGAPTALPGPLVLLWDVAQHGDDQAPGEFGGAFARAPGAADRDAQLGRRLGVEGGVPAAGGDQQPQLGQPGQYRPGEGSALPHPHDQVEIFEPLHKLVFVVDVVVEILDLGPGGQLRPVAQVLGRRLVIVQYC